MNKEAIEMIIKRFRVMRLPVMADELLMMIESNEISTLTIMEILDRISSEELVSRKNNTVERLRKKSRLSQRNASLNTIDYDPQRKIISI